MRSEPYAYIAAAGILATLLAYLLWTARPSQRRTATAVLASTLFFWLVGEILVAFSTDPVEALVAIRGTYAAIVFIPVAAQGVVFALDESRTRWHRLASHGLIGFALLSGFLLPTPLLIAGAWRDGAGFHRVSGPLFPVLAAGVVLGLLVVVALAYWSSRHAPHPLARQRSQCFFAGFAAAAAIGIADLGVLQPLGIHGHRMFVAPLEITVAMGVLIYAVARTRLVDVATTLRQTVVYGALVATLLVPCLGLSLLAESLMTGRIAFGPSVVTACLFCLAGFIFPRLRVGMEEPLQQALFGARADHRRLLQELSREVTTLLSLPTLASVIHDQLGRAFGEADARLWLFQGERLVPVEPRGDAAPLELGTIGLDQPWESVVVSEVEDGDPRAGLVAVLRPRGIEVAVVLRVKNRTVGLLTLGARLDDRFYSDDDVALVATLANQLAIAVENARLYDELRTSREEVNRATRLSAVGTLAAGVAHEIRNPLVAVRTFLQLFPTRLHDQEFTSTFGKLALSEVDRVTALITELLTFARSHERALTNVDVAAVADRVCGLLRPAAKERNVTLETAPTGGLAPVYGDGDQLEQVLLNVVLNAIEASPSGGTVTVRLRAADRYVRLEVTDRGPGIPEEHQELIFAPFFTTKDSGTGLGLAVAHHLVAEHGGTLAATSTPGDGTTFSITLPVSTEASSPASQAA